MKKRKSEDEEELKGEHAGRMPAPLFHYWSNKNTGDSFGATCKTGGHL
jgi:hypothetical protein